MTRYTVKDDTHYWGWPTSPVIAKSGNMWIGATHANNHSVSSGIAYAIKSTDNGHTWGSDVLVDAEDTGYVSIFGCLVAVDISPTVRRILCYIQRYYAGTGTYKAVFIYTDDEFVTMSTPVELSANSWVPYGEYLTTPLGKILIPVFNYANAWQLAHFKTTDYGANHTLVAGITDTTNKPYESSWSFLPNGKIRRVCRNFKWNVGNNGINPIMYIDSTDTEGETWDASMSELPFGYQMDTNLASLKHTDGKYYLFQGVSKGTVWRSSDGLNYSYLGTYAERAAENYLQGAMHGRPISLSNGKIGIVYHTGDPGPTGVEITWSNLYYVEYDPTNPTGSTVTHSNKTPISIDHTKCGTVDIPHFLYLRTIPDSIASDFYNNIKTDEPANKSNVTITGLKSGLLKQSTWPLTVKNAIVICDTPLSHTADTQILLKQNKTNATMDYAGMLADVGCKAFYPLNEIAGKFSDLAGNYGDFVPNGGLIYQRRYKQFDYDVYCSSGTWLTNNTFGGTDLIDYNKAFSIGILVNWASDVFTVICQKRTESGIYPGWMLITYPTINGILFYMGNNNVSNALLMYFDGVAVTAGHNYLIFITHDGSGKASGTNCYINGVNSTTHSGWTIDTLTATISNSSDFRLNAANDGANSAGMYASFLMAFNRKLNASEVTAYTNELQDPENFSQVGTLINTSTISSFSQSTVSDGSSATSTIDRDGLVSSIQAVGSDTYFDTTSEVARVDIYYTHQDGRQKKRLIHQYPGFAAGASWSSFARDGTWAKTKIRAFDWEGAKIDLDGTNVPSGEDLTHSSGVMNLNT